MSDHVEWRVVVNWVDPHSAFDHRTYLGKLLTEETARQIADAERAYRHVARVRVERRTVTPWEEA